MNKNIINLIDKDFYYFLLKYYNSKSSEYYGEKYSLMHFICLIYYSFNKINFCSKRKIYNELSDYLEEDYKNKCITEEQYKDIKKMYVMLAKKISFSKKSIAEIEQNAIAIMAGSIAKYDSMINIGGEWNELWRN